MIAPVDVSYYERMKSRLPLQNRYDRYDFFYRDTRLLFGRLLRLIVESESKLEALRQNMKNMPRFSVRNLFEKILLLNRKNYIIKDDVKIIRILFDF